MWHAHMFAFLYQYVHYTVVLYPGPTQLFIIYDSKGNISHVVQRSTCSTLDVYNSYPSLARRGTFVLATLSPSVPMHNQTLSTILYILTSIM